MTLDALAVRVLAGDARALARAITLVENEGADAAPLMAALYRSTGRAYLVGITGPPGAGKSTLVDRLATGWRRDGQTIGVIAVDPTSPFTGGALLGDRVRMQQHAGDAGVFIRSMATRGHLGGLARTTGDVALLFDAAGRDLVIIETVGVGQDEVDVVRAADISIVVVVPGTGDEVQALKAGLMEIADIFIVNKADREGADRAVASIEALLSLQTFGAGTWRPPVLRTEATTGTGIDAVRDAVARFRAHTAGTQGQRRRTRAEFRVRELLGRRFLRHLEEHVLAPGELAGLLDRVAARGIDPYGVAELVASRALRPAPQPWAPDHVAVAVRDVAPILHFFGGILGLAISDPEDVPSQGVRVRFVNTGDTRIEVLEPLPDDSAVGRFLDKHGPSLHHVALAVDDLTSTLSALAGKGVRLIDSSPRIGAGGALIAFVHPSSTGGVLVELKQRP